MSKFSTPRAKATPTQAEIDRVIGAAEAHDATPAANGEADKEIRFTMVLSGDQSEGIDASRKRSKLTRLAWIRLAIAEKLEREGR